MDLNRRSLDSLDWPVVLDALANQARTPRGERACRALSPLPDAVSIRRAYDAIDELRRLESDNPPLPVGGVGDIERTVIRAEKGEVLEADALREAASSLRALRMLRDRLDEAADDAPRLFAIGQDIVVDPDVTDELERAFDPTGQLSGTTYPELAELRTRITGLHDGIRRTLETLVHGDELGDLLQDRFVTQRGDRYVIPIKAHAKNWDLGIVHGTSGSGRTVFVEPTAVVAMNNALRIAEGELAALERRILTMLSLRLGRIAPPVLAALEAATTLDLACAREGLASALNATRPTVGEDGVIKLLKARHPVLVLRGVDVIANDLGVDPGHPALVLTGPNTGGKTVALKTMGLCALLVGIGAFIPAADGSRCDRFEQVLADIGDVQTVHEGLSSFSGHLVVLRAMLDAAAPGRLFLLDELCNGTDPAQGGALARAVLEALLDRSPRLVATTHFAPLKGLAAADPRFRLSAMEYANGRPTYRVVADSAGESHAFDTARRMGLPDEVVTRAEGHLEAGERALAEAIRSLEGERDRARAEVDRVVSREAALAAREAALATQAAALEVRRREMEERATDAFLDRLRAAERAIGAVVADLQRNPDPKRARAARSSIDALRGLAPTPPEPPPPPDIAIGDRVRAKGTIGEVVAVDGDQVTLRVGALSVRVPTNACEPVTARPAPAQKPPKTLETGKVRIVDVVDAVRVPGNTLDLRGMRVEEAMEEIDRFLARASQTGHDLLFLLHGHGTGALKDAIRKDLRAWPSIKKLRPANADQGGDAFTVVELRGA